MAEESVAEEEYEILPHKRLETLEREVEKLSKHPLGSSAQGKNLIKAIESLELTITRLINVFHASATKLGGASIIPESGPDHDKLDKRINEVANQNQQIAEAIVALADQIKEMKSVLQKNTNRDDPKPLKNTNPQKSIPAASAISSFSPTDETPAYAPITSSQSMSPQSDLPDPFVKVQPAATPYPPPSPGLMGSSQFSSPAPLNSRGSQSYPSTSRFASNQNSSFGQGTPSFDNIPSPMQGTVMQGSSNAMQDPFGLGPSGPSPTPWQQQQGQSATPQSQQMGYGKSEPSGQPFFPDSRSNVGSVGLSDNDFADFTKDFGPLSSEAGMVMPPPPPPKDFASGDFGNVAPKKKGILGFLKK